MEILIYEKEFKDRIIDLLSDGSSEKRNVKAMLWDWQYMQGPFAKENKCVGLLMIDSGHVVGFNGFMPVLLHYKENLIEGAWSCDTFISPRYRGKGYGLMMAKAVMKKYPIVMGLGISDIQAHLMRKIGYKECRYIERMAFTQRIGSVKDVIKKGQQYIKITKNINKGPSTSGIQVRVIDAENVPSQVDLLWREVASGFSKIMVKNLSYLKLKYGSHPFLKYQMIIVERNKALVGLGVFRKGHDISRLLDYIGPSKNKQIKFLIVKSFKEICSDSKSLECICTDEELKATLRYLGFRVGRSKPRFYVWSNIKGDQEPEEDWFVMGGDSDGDIRP